MFGIEFYDGLSRLGGLLSAVVRLRVIPLGARSKIGKSRHGISGELDSFSQ